MAGSFVSDYVLNLSQKVLAQTEINLLGKGLGFSATPSFIKEADFRRDFNEVLPGKREKFNLTREECLPTRNFQGGRNVIIKPADKGSAVVIWDRKYYLKEA